MNTNPCPLCRVRGCDGKCGVEADPLHEPLRLVGCFIRLGVAVAIAIVVWLVAGCTLVVEKGETGTLRGYHDRATVAPGGAILIPADPELAQEHLDEMNVWQCPTCAEWLPDEFHACSSCGTRKP